METIEEFNLDEDKENFSKEYYLNIISELKKELTDKNNQFSRINDKLETIRYKYEKLDVDYDIIYSLLTKEQKKELIFLIS
jgi:hypothetical protein